jgi:phage-related tail fiber protein
MLKKLFGGKSNNNYYLQLEETEATQTTQAANGNGKVESPEKVVEVKSTETQPTAKVEEKQATEPAKATSSQKKKSAKTKSSKKQSVETAPVTTAVSSSTSSDDTPFWVKAMYKSSSNNQEASQESNTFATKYLLSNSTQSRRRPGPSLNKFREMARKANTRL